MDDMPVRILHHWDQKIDTAESVAKELAYSYSLKDCGAEDAVAFRAWLAGGYREMPETTPRSKYVAYCFVTETNQGLCQLSQYSPFPERLCAYVDSEYVRNGTCSIFAFVEPLGGRHHTSVHVHRTALDWAHEIKYLSDVMYPDAVIFNKIPL